MIQCPHPDCGWQAIAASTAGAEQTYVAHVLAEHSGATDELSVDMFEQSPGDTSEQRSHETEQVFLIFEGEFVLHTEDDSFELSASDSVRLDAGERHYSENPGERPCVGLRVSAPGDELSGGLPN